LPHGEESHRFKIVVIGHITVDKITIGTRTRYEMGGPSAYAMVAPTLGMNPAAIISRVGKDFPAKYLQVLRASGLHPSGILLNSTTTLFVNRYNSQGDRTQQAPQVADLIMVDDIPSTHWNTTWMHLSPVLKEVDSHVILEAKRRGIWVSVDVQGFIRDRISAQEPDVIPCPWEEFPNVASKIDVLKADVEEICHLTQQSTVQDAAQLVQNAGCPLILITRGQRGSFIFSNDTLQEVPAIPSQTVVDFTGSGDVFAISFLFEFGRTGRPVWSAFFASTVASFNIETPGPTGFPSIQSVSQRLQQFLQLPGNQKYLELILEEPGPGKCPISFE
jgi:sugar/nucleoside kinase (ribokinase family)